MKPLLPLLRLACAVCLACAAWGPAAAAGPPPGTDAAAYFAPLRAELEKTWPDNRTVRLAFHGHSVPAGYFATPTVRRFDSYPTLLHAALCEAYPTAVIDVNVTAVGGENAEQGAARFAEDVLRLKPDVVFLDYSLNDRRLGLDRAAAAWRSMLRQARAAGVPAVLLTPTPDSREDLLDAAAPLARHAAQVRALGAEFAMPVVDSHAAFRTRVAAGADVTSFLSQPNHPNRAGHEIVAGLLAGLFAPPADDPAGEPTDEPAPAAVPDAARPPLVGPGAGRALVERGGLVVGEAEDFAAQTHADVRAFHLVTTERTPAVAPDGDPPHADSAAGNAYLEVLPDTRRTHDDKLIRGANFAPEPGGPAVLSYRVRFATPGRYHVWVRAFSTGTEDNSLHVGLNDDWPESGRRMQWCEGKGAWRWESKQRTDAEHCGEPHKIYLDVAEPGEHVVRFSMREDGFEFDRWLMTLDRDFARPAGAGPPASDTVAAAAAAAGDPGR